MAFGARGEWVLSARRPRPSDILPDSGRTAWRCVYVRERERERGRDRERGKGEGEGEGEGEEEGERGRERGGRERQCR